MSERKNSVDGQMGVVRSDSAMNAEDARGSQKGKLPIWRAMELNSVANLPWVQRAAVHLVVYAVVKSGSRAIAITPGYGVSEDLSPYHAELAVASGSQLPDSPSTAHNRDLGELDFYVLPLIRPSGTVRR